MWRDVRAYLAALIRRWAALMAGPVLTLALAIVPAWRHWNVPAWMWSTIFLAGVPVAGFLAWREERSRRRSDAIPVLRLGFANGFTTNQGVPPDHTLWALNATVANDGGPSTLQNWRIEVQTTDGRTLRAPAYRVGAHGAFSLVGAGGGNDRIVIPTTDGLEEKTANDVVIHGGQKSGWLVFAVAGMTPEKLSLATRFTVSATGLLGGVAHRTGTLAELNAGDLSI